MTARRPGDLQVACSLEARAFERRSDEWKEVRRVFGLGAEPMAGGGRLFLHHGAGAEVARLIAAEGACCSFLDFALSRDSQRLVLEVTSQAPDAGPVIAALVGLPPPT